MSRVPGYLDRYPAKMVGHLAAKLVHSYAKHAKLLLDPFCGSGAILKCAGDQDIPVWGLDVNPYAVLMSRVKLEGFHALSAVSLAETWINNAQTSSSLEPIQWENKRYWFTTATLEKYERLRMAAKHLKLGDTAEGRSALLALALSVRRCSRADQRSPKPFISRTARLTRYRKHFDPYKEIKILLKNLCRLYGKRQRVKATVSQGDAHAILDGLPCKFTVSHVITSPPYINAQDYFRNFKLELYVLEDLIEFDLKSVRDQFIGTERGNLLQRVTNEGLKLNARLFPPLIRLRSSHPKKAAVVDKYFVDIHRTLSAISRRMKQGGVFVLVCGDNLVAGYSIPTWKVLREMLQRMGFDLAESFGDRIERRYIPPVRKGHRGLIKREVVSVFRKSRRNGIGVSHDSPSNLN